MCSSSPNTEFLLTMRRISKLRQLQLRNIRTQHSMTQLEVEIIIFLHNNPGYDTARDIVMLRDFPKGNVSVSVDSLIRHGYLTSERDSKDRRRIHLSLTPKAGRIIQESDRLNQQAFDIMFRGFSPEEKEQFRAMTARIFRNITEATEREGLEL